MVKLLTALSYGVGSSFFWCTVPALGNSASAYLATDNHGSGILYRYSAMEYYRAVVVKPPYTPHLDGSREIVPSPGAGTRNTVRSSRSGWLSTDTTIPYIGVWAGRSNSVTDYHK